MIKNYRNFQSLFDTKRRFVPAPSMVNISADILKVFQFTCWNCAENVVFIIRSRKSCNKLSIKFAHWKGTECIFRLKISIYWHRNNVNFSSIWNVLWSNLIAANHMTNDFGSTEPLCTNMLLRRKAGKCSISISVGSSNTDVTNNRCVQ